MSFRNTIFFAVILVALGAYVYFYEIKGGEKRKVAAERAKKVFQVEKDSINSIILQPTNIHLKKVGNSWEITEPIKSKTEERVVSSIVTSLANAEKERTIAEAPTDYRAYGFSDTSAQIILEYPGKIDTLFIGEKNPTGSFVFARKGGSPEIFLTGTNLYNNVKKNLFDLRDKTILNFDKEDVKKVNLKIGKKTFVASKQENDWELEKPAQFKGDKFTFNRIFNKIKNSRVKKFIEENPPKLSRYGLDRPRIKLDLFLGEDNSKKTLLIGKEQEGNYFAKDESRSPVFLVDAIFVSTLDTLSLFDLRDKKINNFDPLDVTRVEFEYPKTRIVCQKDTAGDWRIILPEETKARAWKITRILGTLQDLKAEGFLRMRPEEFDKFGFKNSRGKIVAMKNDQILAGLLIGNATKQRTYVKNLLKDEGYLVKTVQANSLIIDFESLAETEVASNTEKDELNNDKE
jgi:hypothetical protein